MILAFCLYDSFLAFLTIFGGSLKTYAPWKQFFGNLLDGFELESIGNPLDLPGSSGNPKRIL